MLLVVNLTANAQFDFWRGANLGSPAQAGSLTTNVDNSITITAGGNDIWGGSDNGYYYSTWVDSTAWEATVKVRDFTVSSSFGGNAWAKAELMVRLSDPNVGHAGNDAFIAMMLAPGQGNGNGSQYRASRGIGAADAGNTGFADSMPNWLKLTRNGSVFTVQSSVDGTTWRTSQTIDTANTANGFGTAWPSLVTVGLAVTAHSDANAVGDIATVTFENLTLTGATFTTPTAITVLTEAPADVNTYVGSEASMSFRTSNNGFPNPTVLFANSYQWYRGSTPLPGCTRTAITFLATAADNNATFYCVSKLPAPWDNIVKTSVVSTVHVNASTVDWTGGLKLEVFPASDRGDVYETNVPRGNGSNQRPPVAGTLRWLDAFEDGGGYGNNTSRRVTGYFIPWQNGNYTFFVAADDDTDVYLGVDSTPASKRIICQEPEWSGYNSWTNAGGGGTNAIAQKCSNTWTNGAGVVENPTGIALVGGTKYWLEMVVHNGGGGDNAGLTAMLYDTAVLSPPENNTPSTLRASSNNIALISWQATPTSWTLQPVDSIGVLLGDAIFRAQAASTGELTPHYQWYRGSAPIAGATSTVLVIPALAQTDHGAQIKCVATVPTVASITSSVAQIVIVSGVFEPGFAANQKWQGTDIDDISMQELQGGNLGPPTFQNVVPALEASQSNANGDYYGRKLTGMFIPPANGAYVFWTCSDDQSEVYLSTDATAANKRLLCEETAWSNTRLWGTSGDGTGNGSIVSQKRSDTWTNSAGATPWSAGINLVGGQRYYIEVLTRDGTGGDNVSVTYTLIGESAPPNGEASKITGARLGFYAPPIPAPTFTLQPTNPGTIIASPFATARFYAAGTSTSTYAVGDVNADTQNQFVFFQWMKNGVDIPGATATAVTLTGFRMTDNNAQIRCRMRALGYGTPPDTRLWVTSSIVNLTVVGNPADAPVVSYVSTHENFDTFPSLQYLTIAFSGAMMDPASLTNPANYTLPAGAAIDTALPMYYDTRNLTHVAIPLQYNPSLPTGNVTVTGVKSWSQITAPTATLPINTVPFVAANSAGMKNIGNLTTTGTDPAFPSKLWHDGPNAYTIAAQGSDIWNPADGFNFMWQEKSGNFDVVLRQKTYSVGNRWAKCGLMARETLEPGSRNWNVVNDPPDVPCLTDGNGANLVEANWRPAGPTPGNTTGADSANWHQPFTQLPPTYPNAWVRLKRENSLMTAYRSTDGQNWTMIASNDVAVIQSTNPLPAMMYVGICVTGHHNDSDGIFPPASMDSQLYWNIVSVDNFNSAYVPAPILTYTVEPGGLVLSWTPAGGTLYSSSDFVSWTLVGTANPSAPQAMTGAPKFYRVVRAP
jgi:hypothetical protein